MLELGPALFHRLNEDLVLSAHRPLVFGEGGLSEEAIGEIERQLDLPFPPDFRYLLMNLQDPGELFFPWARFSLEKYNQKIDAVWEGIAFDIEEGVWLKRWGQKPADQDEAIELAKRDFETWPRLLPLLGHRFLTATPCLPNNPVFSVMQTDIIYYGTNLADYLVRELTDPGSGNEIEVVRKIDVWSDFAEDNEGWGSPE